MIELCVYVCVRTCRIQPCQCVCIFYSGAGGQWSVEPHLENRKGHENRNILVMQVAFIFADTKIYSIVQAVNATESYLYRILKTPHYETEKTALLRAVLMKHSVKHYAFSIACDSFAIQL